jgi:hypothetical protein
VGPLDLLLSEVRIMRLKGDQANSMYHIKKTVWYSSSGLEIHSLDVRVLIQIVLKYLNTGTRKSSNEYFSYYFCLYIV